MFQCRYSQEGLEAACAIQLKRCTDILDMRTPRSLEACMIDEHGMAVHEECSVGKIAERAHASTPLRGLPAKTRTPN
jgi:hypothetical protein